MIAAVIPVHGRLPLVKLTVRRLIEKNKVKVICVGNEPEIKEAVEALGAEWVDCKNEPLGEKWNTGFMAVQKYRPDWTLYLGSSDWVNEAYTTEIEKQTGNFDLIGKLGCYFADIAEDQKRVCFWHGYPQENKPIYLDSVHLRYGEPIGIGRALSCNLLDMLKWRPFEDQLPKSMDFSMWAKVLALMTLEYLDSKRIGIMTRSTADLLSISTNKWRNMHTFGYLWQGRHGIIDYIDDHETFFKNFPEVYEL